MHKTILFVQETFIKAPVGTKFLRGLSSWFLNGKKKNPLIMNTNTSQNVSLCSYQCLQILRLGIL